MQEVQVHVCCTEEACCRLYRRLSWRGRGFPECQACILRLFFRPCSSPAELLVMRQSPHMPRCWRRRRYANLFQKGGCCLAARWATNEEDIAPLLWLYARRRSRPCRHA